MKFATDSNFNIQQMCCVIKPYLLPPCTAAFGEKKKKSRSSESGEEIVKSRLVPLTRHGYDYKGITTALGKTSGAAGAAAAAGWTSRAARSFITAPRADNAALLTRAESNICQQIGSEGTETEKPSTNSCY